ncbi:MAG: hypothetical protein KAJ64_05205 [Thermoplasmata archaeon]|nr:hypothetical protein [Thermoplasmata archaeon]
MILKKSFAIATVVAMLSVSFAVGVSISVQGGTSFLESTDVPWLIEFTPNDIAWDSSGSVAIVVGTNSSAPGTNAYVYDYKGDAWHDMVQPDTYMQAMNGVCWDQVRSQFWLVGSVVGAETSSVYTWAPGEPNVDLLQDYPLTGNFYGVSTDTWGNPMVAGYYQDVYYLNVDTTIWHNILEFDTPIIQNHILYSIDYNWNDHRFYMVGEYWLISRGSGNGYAAMYYSDPADGGPLDGAVSKIYHDDTTELAFLKYFNSINWNTPGNYALVVGSAIYKLEPGPVWTEIKEEEYIADGGDHLTEYTDVSWDTDGYGEAAIVGVRWSVGNGFYSYYWRYVPSTTGLLDPLEISQIDSANCVDFKPPSSPKLPMVPMASGGIIVNVQATDPFTTITANAVFPKLWWIGFNDSLMNSEMDQQVPVDDNYYFTLQGNYSQGWANVEVVVQAWYDNGAAPSVYPAENEANRDLAFTIVYEPVGPSTTLTYPTLPDLEITVGAAVDTELFDFCDNHTVEIPIWLGPQIRSATYGGVAPIGPLFDQIPGNALNNIESWDFNVTIRDAVQTTASNTSYGEFGIQEAVSILVAGNPAGNAPPGTNDNMMNNPSLITYSSNADHWVNVSLEHLWLNGNILSGFNIPVTDVSVANSNWIASQPYTELNLTDCPTGRAFVGEGLANGWCVWGNRSEITQYNPAPANGTTAFGPFGSNYNAAWVGALGASTTQLDWWVDVQAGKPEGIYFATITITIDS